MDIKPLEVLQTTSINAPITTRPPPSSDKRSKVRGNDWYKKMKNGKAMISYEIRKVEDKFVG